MPLVPATNTRQGDMGLSPEEKGMRTKTYKKEYGNFEGNLSKVEK